MRQATRTTIAGLGVIASLVLLAGPVNAAAAGVLDATYTLEVTVPASAMAHVYAATTQQVPAAGTPVPVSSCGRDHFTVNGTANWFRFHEEQTENGCGEALYTFNLPYGTRAIEVQFAADRVIRQSSQVDLPKSMFQQLRVYDQNRSAVATFDYFDGSAAAHEARVPFHFPVPLQPEQANMTVGWFFRDAGATFGQAAVNPLFGQSLYSTITGASVVLQGIPAGIEDVHQDRSGVQGGSVHTTTVVRTMVPQGLSGLPGRLSLHVRVTSDLAFAQVIGPGGDVIPAEYLESSEAEGAREVVVTGNGTAHYGPGDYQVFFTSATPLYSSPGLYAFAIVVIAVPAIAGLLSIRLTRSFRRQATPQFVTTATNLDRLVIAMLGAYMLLPLTVVAGGRLPLLTTVPLSSEAALIYFLVAFAFAAFVIVGFVGRRQLSSIMRAEAATEERARIELERSNRELEEFAYVASHDLQEPLRTVASYAQLLQRRYKGKLDADADTYIANTVTGAMRMQGLIKDLLTYSRVGARPDPTAPVDLPKVLEQVRADLAPAIAEAGADLRVGPLPTVTGHERELQQVFQNLVGNALKFRAAKVRPVITVAAHREEAAWRFTVRDNGIGIEAQHHKQVFQIFQQLHNREEYAGTGIGLAICKRIVELKHGQIGVESELGKGSIFWFTWPDEQASPAARWSKK